MLGVLLGGWRPLPWHAPVDTQPDAAQQAAACRAQWPAQSASGEGRESARAACFREVQSDMLLRELQLRRARFLQQASEGAVLLVVVVIITLSGIALAAVQFAASYRLATAGGAAIEQPSEVTIEQGRITLKSSVTGLVVLACSLAFFTVFVIHVHPIREVGPRDPPAAAAPRQLESGEIVPGPAR